MSVLSCVVFGLLLVALIHTTGDGSWFWYADALHRGQHLYGDLHLPMQPLYAIELATLLRIFGRSWMAQQVIGVVNLLLFLLSLALVNRHNRWPPWQKALVHAAAFWAAMDFISMRFDDYHVLSLSCELLCADALLRLKPELPLRRNLLTVVTLGLLCGTCVLNRLNDGVLLTAAVAAVAVFWLRRPRERLLAAGLIWMIVLAVVFGSLALMGEMPRNWFRYTVQAAAAIKGGAGSMWMYPLRLPAGTLREMFARGWRFASLTVYTIVAAIGAAWLARRNAVHAAKAGAQPDADPGTKSGAVPRAQRSWLGYALALLLVSVPFAKNIVHGNEARVIVACAVLAMYAAALWWIYARLTSRSAHRRPAEAHTASRTAAGLPGGNIANADAATNNWLAGALLLLLPFSQLVSISLSAARWYPNTNPPAAAFLLLLPIALPSRVFRQIYRAPFLVLLVLLIVSGAVDKLRDPFDWFYYRSLSINAPRLWYGHPLYGRMLMEKDQLALMQPVCEATAAQGNSGKGANVGNAAPELLSMPFTFANYFCGIQPWHGYVQTFYDTSSRATIETIESQLRQSPPEWILYQRQIDILRENEIAFHHGSSSPHRELDSLMMERIRSGTWKATVLPSPAYDKSTWMLIHTGAGHGLALSHP